METRRENHLYAESGLPNVTLLDVEVRQCPRCGERAVAIPRIDELHRVLALAVIHKSARLAPQEVRFLRKYLGWSGSDFARHMGVAPETVSRWENGKEPMGPVADRLLRLMVAHGKPIEEYPLEALTGVAKDDAEPGRLEAFVHGSTWHAKAA